MLRYAERSAHKSKLYYLLYHKLISLFLSPAVRRFRDAGVPKYLYIHLKRN